VASLFFVRDGKGGDNTSQAHEVPVKELTQKLQRRGLKHFNTAPHINPENGPANAFAPYRHIVVEIGADETNATFAKPGFYYVMGLSPHECSELFDIPNP
jgi:hypothetical protein